MDPRDASVYTDNYSALTWVLILSVVIVCVMGLMVAFIALVHHSIEHSADTPKAPLLEGLPSTAPASGSTTPTAVPGSSSPSHAA